MQPLKRTRAPKVTKVKRAGRKQQWRAQVWDSAAQKFVSANAVLRIEAALYDTKTEANAVAKRAMDIIAKRSAGHITVAEAREQWLARTHHKGSVIKTATHKTNAERTAPFAKRYGEQPVALIDDEISREWAETCPASHIEGLRQLFAWCVKRRWAIDNPFRHDWIEARRTKGNAKKNPPPQHVVDRMIGAAYGVYPSYGAWLEFAVWTGCRPGEIDALRWGDLSRDLQYVTISRQYNARGGTTTPKNGQTRTVAVPAAARRALMQLGRTADPRAFVFTNTRGGHFTQTSRQPYWKVVRLAVPEIGSNPDMTTYLCTRHFCGWYLVNERGRSSEDVAIQLGHTDGGELVRRLYGHRDERRAIDGILADDEQAA